MKIPSISGLSLFVTGFILFYCSTVSAANAKSEPRLFEPDSLKKIENVHDGQPFLLVMWSLDCPPCREELNLLSEITKRHREFQLVLVSTDTAESSEQLAAVLESHQLHKTESWVFSGAGAERLRYEIDPDWYGEIPRSYFYDRNHQRIALSGALKKEQIEAWLKSLITATVKKSN